MLSLHSLNRHLFASMDVHARLRGLATNLEALQHVPVGIVTFINGDFIDAHYTFI